MSETSAPRVRISTLINRKSEMVRTFEWKPNAHGTLPLRVTLKHRPAAAINEELDREKTRLLVARRQTVTIQDVSSQQKILDDLLCRILAEVIIKIESANSEKPAVTIRHLKGLLNLSAQAVGAAGGLDYSSPFDTTAKEPEAVEDAKVNIIDLLHECPEFHQWVQVVASEVGYFQDEKFEEEVKNYVAKAS